MTPSGVVTGGALPAGGQAPPRGKGAPASPDGAFALVLGEAHMADMAETEPAEWSVPFGELLAASNPAAEATNADRESPGRSLTVDPASSREAWNTLAIAWAAATAVSDESVVEDGSADVAEGTALRDARLDNAIAPEAVTGSPLDAAADVVATTRVVSTGDAPAAPDATAPEPTASMVPERFVRAPDRQAMPVQPTADHGVGSSSQLGDDGPTGGGHETLEPGQAPVPEAGSQAQGHTPGPQPTQTAAPVSARGHEAREATIDSPVLPRPDEASPADAPAVTPVPAERSASAPGGGREPERTPSLPDASTLVVAPAPARPTHDVGFGVSMDASAPAATDAAAVVDQVVKSMRVQWKNGIGEARIQLRPEHLGPVDISIKVDGGSITAVVRAESSQVQEWILSHQQSLRQQLEAAGLRLDALVVSPDAERRRDREAAEARQHSAPRRRRAAGETPIFEVTV